MVIDFNHNWIFTKQNGESYIVNLPHDAMLTEKRYAECRNAKQSGYFPGGKYKYEKTFSILKSDLSKSIELLFEGVYQNATVLINNIQVAFHKYGYTEFTVNISDFVKVGENKVEVLVDNSLVPNCRWYSGSGIYRPVSLIIRDKIHIKDITVKTLSYNPAIINVSANVSEDVPLTVEIRDGNTVIAKGLPGSFTIVDANLWDESSPYLYTCTVTCPTDSMTVNFGIRKIQWSAKTGLLINGKETLLRGGCIHHDNGVLGACGFADAEERQVRILKENGFNALRSAHNPASRALLDACDRLGVYVIDEAFDGWYIPKDYHDYSRVFFKEYKNDLKSMVMKDINHPSVIMYSLGNEVTETASQEGIRLCNEMFQYAKALDSTRPITCGINVLLNVYVQLGMGVYKEKGEYKAEPLPDIKGRYKEKKAGSAFFNFMAGRLGRLMFFMSKNRLAEKTVRNIAPSLDIVGLNYASSRYDIDVRKYPERMMLGTETMVADLPYNWQRVKKYKALIGDFVWSAWDYLGEACIGDWTYHSYKGLPLLAGQGMIDITGKPLASMAFMQVVWGLRKEPFIGVRPLNHSDNTPSKGAWQFTNAIDSWNWQGYEGKKTIVEVYSDASIIRLELDNKIIGIKKLKEFKALFHVRYMPGKLMAIALDENGKEISRSTLITGSNKTILTVKVSKTIMKANNQDLCFAEIEFTDEYGVLKPYIEQRVELEINGQSVVLQGFGSALCKTDEVFDKTYHNSYRGRVLAVFRATDKKGATEVTIKSKGVLSVKLNLEVK
jgi:beta-galactosidase